MPFHSGYGYYGTGDWLWSIFSTALFIMLLTVAIMMLVRMVSGSRRQAPGAASRPVGGPWFGPGPGGGYGAPAGGQGGPDAERILAERYARGEISEEEYRGRLDVLRQTGHATGWAQPQQDPVPQQRPVAKQDPVGQQQPVAQRQPTEEVR